MKNITRWSPDTCQCVIDFESDTDHPNDDPKIKRVEKSCEAHKKVKAEEHLITVLDENRRVGKAYQAILASLAGVTIEELPPLLQQKADEICRKLIGVDLITASTSPEMSAVVQACHAAACVNIGGLHRKEYQWAFDNDRNLVVTLPERLKAKSAKVQSDVAKHFGEDKLKVK